MAENTFVVNKIYYQCGIKFFEKGNIHRPIVIAWQYDGIVKLNCNSKACDQPYHFLQFTRVPVDIRIDSQQEPDHAFIASFEQAKKSMFTWKYFLEVANDLDDRTET